MQEVECEKIERLWVVKSRPRSAQENMDLDAKHLKECKEPILHFYNWKSPSLTYGYFTKPEMHLIAGHPYDMGRRSTGGGILFHTHDIAFSLVVPAMHPLYSQDTLQNYRRINQVVLNALLETVPNLSLYEEKSGNFAASDPRFCMAKPTIYDVCLGPWKIAGAAQRLKKHALLHQGSLSLALPDWDVLQKSLINASSLIPMMKSCSLELTKQMPLDALRENMRRALLRAFLVASEEKNR